MLQSDADFPSDLRALEREYELIRELGQGGMAAVYLARNRRTGRLVAIKAIRSRYLDDADAVQRFAREARTVAGLDHPNIIRTEAIEQIDDRAVAIIMEHVPGGTVRDRLREHGSLGAEQAESILRDVANALGYAHRRGIVHRDVKPENVFLDERRGRALLSDFGIARQIDSDMGITLLGAALGTPQYMSPEQIDGQVVDGRSDIYSLGVLGWEVLTGRRPWAGESLYGIIYKQKHENLPRITSLRPRVPANLLFAIERALVKDRKLRWQTADEFLEQLTYNPPPLLEQTFPPGVLRLDDQPTVRFRPLSLVRDDPPPTTAAPKEPAPSRDVGRRSEAPPPEATPAPLPVAPFASPDDPFRDSGEREVEAPTMSATDLVLPTLEPNADTPFDVPLHRRRGVRALAVLVPLGIAAGTLFAVLGRSAADPVARAPRSAEVTSSAGSIATDSAPTRPVGALPEPVNPASTLAAKPPASMGEIIPSNTPSEPRRTTTTNPSATRRPRSTPPRAGGSTNAVNSAPTAQRAQTPTDSVPPSAVQSGAGKDETASRSRPEPTFEDPFKIPSSTPSSPPALGSGKGMPSERCRIAATADQRACLDAYIAAGDVPLTQAFDALVAELRRTAGTAAGEADPKTVERVKVEQRAWLSVRNAECPRDAAPGAGSFWAQARSTCYTEMAVSRAAELRDAVRRLRRR
jgi:serine/threonine protein kinase/uncharacterized protein YecT (DUF1311 family)